VTLRSHSAYYYYAALPDFWLHRFSGVKVTHTWLTQLNSSKSKRDNSDHRFPPAGLSIFAFGASPGHHPLDRELFINSLSSGQLELNPHWSICALDGLLHQVYYSLAEL
jgi:hypothetical protein